MRRLRPPRGCRAIEKKKIKVQEDPIMAGAFTIAVSHLMPASVGIHSENFCAQGHRKGDTSARDKGTLGARTSVSSGSTLQPLGVPEHLGRNTNTEYRLFFLKDIARIHYVFKSICWSSL
jgi:hypothetical protein